MSNSPVYPDVILIGIQGSGKGTQAKLITKEFGYQWFETGAALRQMAQQSTELGRSIKKITQSGDLVPNDKVMAIVAEYLANSTHNQLPIIFDGIPRSLEQQASLTNLLQEKKRTFIVIEITLSTDLAIQRLLSRAKIEKRADDNLTTIKNRLANFTKYTMPILQIWEQNQQLHKVDGSQAIEKVFADITKILHSWSAVS